MSNADVIAFAFEDKVWVVYDEDDSIGYGIVTGFLHEPGSVLVRVKFGPNRTDFFYQFELSKEKPNKFAQT